MQHVPIYLMLTVCLLTIAGCNQRAEQIEETRRHLKFAISRMHDVGPRIVGPYQTALDSLDVEPIVAPYGCALRELDGATTIDVQWVDPNHIVSEFLICFGDHEIQATVERGGFGSPVPSIHCFDSFVVATPAVASQYQGGMPTIKLSDDKLLQLIASSKNDSATICAILDGKRSNTCPVVHADALGDTATTR